MPTAVLALGRGLAVVAGTHGLLGLADASQHRLHPAPAPDTVNGNGIGNGNARGGGAGRGFGPYPKLARVLVLPRAPMATRGPAGMPQRYVPSLPPPSPTALPHCSPSLICTCVGTRTRRASCR